MKRMFALAALALIGVPELGLADPVKIGVLLPLSGPFASFGDRIRGAMAKESSPGMEFVFEDEGCEPKRALQAYSALADRQQIRLFLGPLCGSPQIVVAESISRRDHFALLGSSAPSRTFVLSNGKMLSTQPPIEREARFLAAEIFNRGYSRVVTVFFENEFSRAHEAAFVKDYRGTVAETFAYATQDASTLKAIALKLRTIKPQAIYLPDASPIFAGFLRELGAIGLSDIPVFSVFSAESPDLLPLIAKERSRVFYSYPETQGHDAMTYFPALAARSMVKAALRCGGVPECTRARIREEHVFADDGSIEGDFVLKHVVDGHYAKVNVP
ncbi:MAG: ABC transporter substrate-binding protein [Deltaproteobacteria bacterium]|nr:ABC transporter substrate-binding protein [Deltaproteobacteria bacterium]